MELLWTFFCFAGMHISGKLLCVGEEAIQHLIDDNNDNNDDDSDGNYDNHDWDDSIYGDAKRHCECGYKKEGHYGYCTC